jgi:hypothetical protein
LGIEVPELAGAEAGVIDGDGTLGDDTAATGDTAADVVIDTSLSDAPPGGDGSALDSPHSPNATDGDASDGAVTYVCLADASFSTDPVNCGACGHSCLGGACEGGVCAPVLVATGPVNARDLVLGGTYLVWNLGNGSMYGCDVTSGVCDAGASQVAAPFTIAIAMVSDPGSGEFYWAGTPGFGDTNPAVLHCPLVGCPAANGSGEQLRLTPNASDVPLGAVAVDNTNVYSVSADCDASVASIFTCPKGGCDGGALFAQFAKSCSYAAVSLLVDDASVYWVDQGSLSGPIQACPKSGPCDGGVAVAAGSWVGQTVSGLAGDERYVYWINGGAGSVLRAPKVGFDAGHVPTLAESTVYGPGAVPVGAAFPPVVDDANLYWSGFAEADAGGGIYYCPKTGCGASNPVSISGPQPLPTGVAADGVSIFWVNGETGTVWRVAKPLP